LFLPGAVPTKKFSVQQRCDAPWLWGALVVLMMPLPLHAPLSFDDDDDREFLQLLQREHLEGREEFKRWKIAFQEQAARGALVGAWSLLPLLSTHYARGLVLQYEQGFLAGGEDEARLQIEREEDAALTRLFAWGAAAVERCHNREQDLLFWNEERGRRDIMWREFQERRLACVPCGCLICWSEPCVRQAAAALGPRANERAEEFTTCQLLGVDAGVSRAVLQKKYDDFCGAHVTNPSFFSARAVQRRWCVKFVTAVWQRMDERVAAAERIRDSERLQEEGMVVLVPERVLGHEERLRGLPEIRQCSRHVREEAVGRLQRTLQ